MLLKDPCEHVQQRWNRLLRSQLEDRPACRLPHFIPGIFRHLKAAYDGPEEFCRVTGSAQEAVNAIRDEFIQTGRFRRDDNLAEHHGFEPGVRQIVEQRWQNDPDSMFYDGIELLVREGFHEDETLMMETRLHAEIISHTHALITGVLPADDDNPKSWILFKELFKNLGQNRQSLVPIEATIEEEIGPFSNSLSKSGVVSSSRVGKNRRSHDLHLPVVPSGNQFGDPGRRTVNGICPAYCMSFDSLLLEHGEGILVVIASGEPEGRCVAGDSDDMGKGEGKTG